MTSTASKPDGSIPSPINGSASRHRHTVSDTSRYVPTQKPVDEVVTTAMTEAQSESSGQIPSDLIATITEKVIKQLQESGLDSTTQAIPPPPLTAVHIPAPQSPSTTASATSSGMPDRVFTPPSPEHYAEYRSHTSPTLPSESRPELPMSPKKPVTSESQVPKRPISPFSQGSETSDKTYTRPKGPPRLTSEKEQTTLERVWGQLFDEEGNATARLGQLLRGLAVHLIEDYLPKHSLVVTPDKMLKYYEDMKLPREAYPWSTIFDDEQTSISRMYRDLKCQHHLVQEKFDQRPDIPGLTPVGFQRWATLLIQADPQAEFERLQKTVLEMPISNPDDKKERFPKEISRRLFPGQEDLQIRYDIEDSISEHAAIVIPRRTSHDSLHSRQDSPIRKGDPASGQNASQTNRPSVHFGDESHSTATQATPQPSNLERERAPYANVPTESIIDDTNPPAPASPPIQNPKPIERERKPYTAQPGGKRQYDDDPPRVPPVTNSNSTNRETSRARAESIINSTIPKPSRSDSSARSRPISIPNTRPMDIPKPEVHHHRAPSTASSAASVPAAGSRRGRSPSFNRGSMSDFRRSDAELRGYPSVHDPYTASMPRSGGEAVLDESDTRKYFEKQARDRVERSRRDEDSKHFGESPRRGYEPPPPSTRRGTEFLPGDDEYYKSTNGGRGYEYQQPYGGPVYR